MPVVYLDAAATSPVEPRVADLVLRLMTEEFGNAGSRTHSYGSEALRQVNLARECIASALASTPDEVIFTSGATEANNLAILGLEAHGRETGRRHLVSTAIEHKAVLEPLAHLESKGFEVTFVAPDSNGRVDSDEILRGVRPETLLVSVMHANNETGAIQPIEAIAASLPDEVLLHVDAAQSFGRENGALKHRRIDLISASGHKLGAPKGIGALIARRRGRQRVPLTPLMFGGGQERGLRPGTLATPLIAGFGLACELAVREWSDRRKRCLAIREEALRALERLGATVHARGGRVLPHILSFAVPGVDSEAIMVAAKDLVAISNGSACTSSSYAASHVLVAMRLPGDVIDGTVRLSWSHETPHVPWDAFVERIEDLRL